MKIKILSFVSKILGYNLFLEDNKKVSVVSIHAIERIEKRFKVPVLLEMIASDVLEKGIPAVHFEYKNRKKDDGVFALKYKNYIWVFSKDKELITLYTVSHTADVLIDRDTREIKNCVIGLVKKQDRNSYLTHIKDRKKTLGKVIPR